MRKPEWQASVVRFIGPVILGDLALFVIVALICWIGGWRTLQHFANGLILAAGVTLLIGLSSILGGWGITRSFIYQHAESAGKEAIEGRVRQDLAAESQNVRFLIQMAVLAAVALAVAMGLQSLVG